jgi:hypothetical protein
MTGDYSPSTVPDYANQMDVVQKAIDGTSSVAASVPAAAEPAPAK